MRFMMLVIPRDYGAAKPGTMPDPDAVAKMMKFNEELQKSGNLIALDGLHPPSMGTRVSFTMGKPPVVTDGPFPESKEVLGGYWMIRAKDKAEAVAWARRAPMMQDCVIEIRQVQEMEDFQKDKAYEQGGTMEKFKDLKGKLEGKR
jgi:hypothetical protein